MVPAPICAEIKRKLPILPKNENEITQSGAILQLPIDDIIPNRSQPRSAFNQNAIVRLADSIRRYGILQPLTVRKILIPPKHRLQSAARPISPDGDYIPAPPTSAAARSDCTVLYELIAGERRLRAARHAGLAHVPCIVINTDDSTGAELAIIENLLREDLNMFEQAEAFRRLMEEFMLTQEEVARRVTLSQSAVANKLRLLRLSRDERQTILSSGLTERHARALLKIQDNGLRARVLAQITARKLNVSATERYIDSILDEMARYHTRCGENPAEVLDLSAISHTELPPSPPIVPSAAEIAPAADVAHLLAPNFAQIPPSDGETAQPGADLMQSLETPVEPPAATAADTKKPLLKGAIRDIRLFYNSIRNATGILEQAGVKTTVQRREDADGITLTIRLLSPTAEKPL